MTERIARVFCEPLDGGAVRQIGDVDARLVTAELHLPRHGLEPARVDVGQREVCAPAREVERERAPDAAGRAGQDHALSFE